MSRNVCLVIAAFAVFTLVGCSRPPMASSQSRTHAATQVAPAPGDTLAQLIALDHQAVAMAQQARAHENLDPQLAELVENIYMHHRRNLSQTRALGDAEAIDVSDTPAIRNERAEDASQLEALGAVGAEAYPRAYLEAVVETNEHALEEIDNATKSTDNEVIRKHLERTRGNFADHMKIAKKLLEG